MKITVQCPNHSHIQGQKDLPSKRLPLGVAFTASMPRPRIWRNDRLLASLVTVRELNVCFSSHRNVQGPRDAESVE